MGGQGAVLGTLLLAEAAFREGKWAQKIPVYGGMRRGGAVTVFLRIDEKPIRRSCGIYEPDAIVVLDPALIKVEATRTGLRKGGIAVLNYRGKPEEVNLGVELSKVATIDATAISTDLFGPRAIPITNTVMLGAVSRATRWVKLESLYEAIRRQFPGRIGELNVEACERGYESVEVWEA
ncbi:MAG: pyruvate/ketoisovalerate ferredoxin oxidoreductase subunit gamma [Candidatus Bathyarchaeota archaeon B23]|nr:MAG: pyruvate/ketoisovalerate ferredoxin oxidoreductase subunit gamma [Candidatus Bathyarchaeota archaeon B23]